MCSIFGIEGKMIPVEKLNACFNRTVSRGPDMSRFVEIPRGYLGFHRLAIMGLTAEGMRMPLLKRLRRPGELMFCQV